MLNLKVGDEVLQGEIISKNPTVFHYWKAKVIRVEKTYIETEFRRDRDLIWLKELTKKLSPIHRTYEKQTIKNYFSLIDNSINIKLI